MELKHAYVDCRADRSQHQAARRIASSAGLELPRSGLSAQECIEELANFLERKTGTS